MMKQSPKILKSLARRWSPLAFSEKPLEQSRLDRLFEAARWAPSSFNEQPWRFIYAHRSEESFRSFLDCLVEGNREWAQHAPVLLLTVAKTFYDYNRSPNGFAHYETGMAMGNLLVQATKMGLYVHQMGGYSKELATKKLEIPEGFEPVAMAAVGYYGKAEDLPVALRRREQQQRNRLPMHEIAMKNRFKQGPT